MKNYKQLGEEFIEKKHEYFGSMSKEYVRCFSVWLDEREGKNERMKHADWKCPDCGTNDCFMPCRPQEPKEECKHRKWDIVSTFGISETTIRRKCRGCGILQDGTIGNKDWIESPKYELSELVKPKKIEKLDNTKWPGNHDIEGLKAKSNEHTDAINKLNETK